MKLLKKYQYILWMGGILVCLIFLFVGLIFGIATKNYGERDTLNPQFSAGKKSDSRMQSEPTSPVDIKAPVQSSDGTLKMLAESADAGQSYLDGLTFMLDSQLSSVKDGGIIKNSNIWPGPDGTIPASSLGSCTVVFPGDGSVVSAINAAMISKPEKLLICVGRDGISDSVEDGFISSYTALIKGIQSASPDTVIICTSIIPVTSAYSGGAFSNGSIISANEWIKTVCTDTGVYFADIAQAVSTNGVLNQDLCGNDGCTLNSSGISKILEYIRTHAIS